MLYSSAPVPPLPEAVIDPSPLSPFDGLQPGLVSSVIEQDNTAGSVMVTEQVVVQPLLSVTVTECSPASRQVAVAVV